MGEKGEGSWNQNGLLGPNILDLITMRQYEMPLPVQFSVQYCFRFIPNSTLGENVILNWSQ